VLPTHQFVQLFGAELPRLAQHLIDERRLAVVNVSNDRNIPYVVPLHGIITGGASQRRNTPDGTRSPLWSGGAKRFL
jgi:hypothetical protein